MIETMKTTINTALDMLMPSTSKVSYVTSCDASLNVVNNKSRQRQPIGPRRPMSASSIIDINVQLRQYERDISDWTRQRNSILQYVWLPDQSESQVASKQPIKSQLASEQRIKSQVASKQPIKSQIASEQPIKSHVTTLNHSGVDIVPRRRLEHENDKKWRIQEEFSKVKSREGVETSSTISDMHWYRHNFSSSCRTNTVIGHFEVGVLNKLKQKHFQNLKTLNFSDRATTVLLTSAYNKCRIFICPMEELDERVKIQWVLKMLLCNFLKMKNWKSEFCKLQLWKQFDIALTAE